MPTANYNKEDHGEYAESCPFCTIASAYPSSTNSTSPSATQSVQELQSAVPQDADVTKVSPSCFLVLSALRVMAFLDILPMTRGHLLVTVRGHREKVQDLEGVEGGEIGGFPFL
jgi:diadenosine tetraphosphate (Ap4A) HIT family hydrolase